MKGYDQSVNVILDECHERVYSSNRGVEQVILGLYIIRGDNMWAISSEEIILCFVSIFVHNGQFSKLPNKNFHLLKPLVYGIWFLFPDLLRALIGELDEDLDSRLDMESIRAEPLNDCKTWRLDCPQGQMLGLHSGTDAQSWCCCESINASRSFMKIIKRYNWIIHICRLI